MPRCLMLAEGRGGLKVGIGREEGVAAVIHHTY
jgi:hypothetical protein